MSDSEDPVHLLSAIENFLVSCRLPAILEPGEEPLPLASGCYHLEIRGPRLLLQAWDEKRNITRRVAGVEDSKRGRLTLRVERFGGRQGSVLLFDQARPANQSADRRGSRMVFRETFRRFLRRQFPDWKLTSLSSDADLEHSLSPSYPRGASNQGVAAGPRLPHPAIRVARRGF